MMKFFNSIYLLFLISIIVKCDLLAQQIDRPKLLVTITIDQMRAEYLYRFYGQFGQSGFKRLMDKGYYCRNVHFNYIPTFTATGHATLFTGTVPRFHGIVGNSWYSRATNKVIYCTEDKNTESVGCSGENGQHSAKNLLATTIADELEIFTQKRSLTYSISLKDRAAILSAGHMADVVLWYDNTTGNFISSSYYMKELPGWVKKFNDKKLPKQYMQQDWNLFHSPESYQNSSLDSNPYEHPDAVIPNIKEASFPYHLAALGKDYSPYDLLIHTPWGNTLLTDLALEVIEKNGIGDDQIPDMLMISFSSTDAIGHLWGPQSKEIEDTYIRLDADIARILNALDAKLGKDNYLVMLTADHAVGEVSQYLLDNKVPSGFFSLDKAAKLADSVLDNRYGQADWIKYSRNHMLYFNHQVLDEKKYDPATITLVAARKLLSLDGVAQAFTAHQLMENEYNHFGASFIQNGFNPNRSGDILILLEPSWSGTVKASSDHGSHYTYDTHVPLIWYGKGISHGESIEYQHITDVAPTISMLLKIKMTNATIGKTIKGIR